MNNTSEISEGLFAQISVYDFSMNKVFRRIRTLSNFKFRNSVLNIEMIGFGNKVKSFTIDGKESADHRASSSLNGIHEIKIILHSKNISSKNINVAENLFSPQTPSVKYVNGLLSWANVGKNISYKVIRNGKQVSEQKDLSFKIDSTLFGDYQIIAVEKKVCNPLPARL